MRYLQMERSLERANMLSIESILFARARPSIFEKIEICNHVRNAQFLVVMFWIDGLDRQYLTFFLAAKS